MLDERTEFNEESLINIISDSPYSQEGVVDIVDGSITLNPNSKVTYQYNYSSDGDLVRKEGLKLQSLVSNLDINELSRYKDKVSIEISIQYYNEVIIDDTTNYNLGGFDNIVVYPYFESEDDGYLSDYIVEVSNKPLAMLTVTFNNKGEDIVTFSKVGLYSSITIKEIVESIGPGDSGGIPYVNTIMLSPRTGSNINDITNQFYYIDFVCPEGVGRNLDYTIELLEGKAGLVSSGLYYFYTTPETGYLKLLITRNCKYKIRVFDKKDLTQYGEIEVTTINNEVEGFEVNLVGSEMWELDSGLPLDINVKALPENLHDSHSRTGKIEVTRYNSIGDGRLIEISESNNSYDSYQIIDSGERNYRLVGIRDGFIKVSVKDYSNPAIIYWEQIIEVTNTPTGVNLRPETGLYEVDGVGGNLKMFIESAVSTDVLGSDYNITYESLDNSGMAKGSSVKLTDFSFDIEGVRPGNVLVTVTHKVVSAITTSVAIEVTDDQVRDIELTTNTGLTTISEIGGELVVTANPLYDYYGSLDFNLVSLDGISSATLSTSGNVATIKAGKSGLMRLEVIPQYGTSKSIDITISNQEPGSINIVAPNNLFEVTKGEFMQLSVDSQYNTNEYTVEWRWYQLDSGSIGSFGDYNNYCKFKAYTEGQVMVVAEFIENGVIKATDERLVTIIETTNVVPTNPQIVSLTGVYEIDTIGEEMLLRVESDEFFKSQSRYEYQFDWVSVDGAGAIEIIPVRINEHNSVKIKAVSNGEIKLVATHQAINSSDINITITKNIIINDLN